MPIYEYQCQECGAQVESLQKVSDPPLVECADCGKPALKKLVSAAGFRLKGSGWYETDFKSKNKRNVEQNADAGSKAKSDGSAPAKSKSEKKTESGSSSSGAGKTAD